MSDDRDIAAAFNEGLEPVMGESPPAPDWESLQFESLVTSRGPGRWWVAGVAAALVLLVGVGSFLLAGRLGRGDGSAEVGGDEDVAVVDQPPSDSIAGNWVLEYWDEGGTRVDVEVDENTPDHPSVEFTETFKGERDSFVSADGIGTAGSFVVWTGCALSEPAGYEYSAGFLVLEPTVLESDGCDADAIEQGLDAAEHVMLAMLSRTDGMEVILGEDRMEWYGSYTGVGAYPLVFRRDGAPPLEPEPTRTTVISAGFAVQVYDVDGVEVVTPTVLTDLPEQATLVEFHTMVIDSGDGPELCMGAVAESLPPQCSGPVAKGLNMDGWAEEANGVRWGDRSVVVTWPPVDGAVDLVSDSEFAPPDVVYPPGELPTVCDGIELGAGVDAIHQYRGTIGDLDGDVYLANDGTLVLQVVGDPEPHREALARLGGACVIEVQINASEQRALHETVHPLIGDALGIDSYSSSTGPGGRIDIYIPVVDRATAELIAELVDDPTVIRLIGMGAIQE